MTPLAVSTVGWVAIAFVVWLFVMSVVWGMCRDSAARDRAAREEFRRWQSERTNASQSASPDTGAARAPGSPRAGKEGS